MRGLRHAMARGGRGLSLGAALLMLGACASTQSAPAREALVPPAAESRPEVQLRTLDNGLRVYLLPDPTTPLVCVQVWVGVGSVHEREAGPGESHGLTGLSHFFEHLMFQGTERYPDYDRALSPLGARTNAFTYNDATAYWAYAPREHLPLLLDIEADRFQHMVVDFVNLETEREVVKNERRLRVDADPAEIAEEQAIARTFDTFSYRWGPIGWMSDLDAVTLEQAQAYHRQHYRPDNAWLVISGDIDMVGVDALLEATWGRLPRVAAGETAPLPPYDTWRGERRDHLTREAPSTTLFLSWRTPAIHGEDARDFAALELIDHALTAGKSGRVNRDLILRSDPIAARLSARLTPLRHPYTWLWRVDLAPGRTSAEAMVSIDGALAEIALEGLAEDEMAQAIATMRADMVRANLSPKDRATNVGFALASTGDPLYLFERLALLSTITNEDIKRVAARFLQPDQRVRFTLVPLSRYREVVGSLLAQRGEPGGLRDLAEASFSHLSRGIELKQQGAELTAEARAIALLEARGARAMAAAESAEARQAIADHLNELDVGTFKRGARLNAQREAHAEAMGAHVAAGKRLRAEVEALVARSRANLRGSIAVPVISALLAPLDEGFAVPRDLDRRGRVDRLVMLTVAALLHDSRGHSAAAQGVREVIAGMLTAEALADGSVGAKGDDAVIAESGLGALLEDTWRQGVPLVEAGQQPAGGLGRPGGARR